MTPKTDSVAVLREAVAEYERLRDHVGGCTDGGCVVKRPRGMHTNGGCHCPRNHMNAQRMMYAGQRLHAAAIAALEAQASAPEVLVDFPGIGMAGPFTPAGNMLTLPAATMTDLAHYFRMGYVEQASAPGEVDGDVIHDAIAYFNGLNTKASLHMAAEIEKCYTALIRRLAAVAPAGMDDAALNGARPLPADRDTLGRFVREAWVRWAQHQPNPKPSWLVPYGELPEADKEADRQIGEAVARWTLILDAARLAAPTPPATAGEE